MMWEGAAMKLVLTGLHEFYYTFLDYVDFWLCNTNKISAYYRR